MKIKTSINNLNNYKIYLRVEEEVNKFFKRKGYLKADLPVLSPALIPESYLEIFETKFRYFNRKEKLYLTPSPELFLKRLLITGIGNCYYLGKAFRNSEPNSSWHLPEFTMLEFYKVGINYLEMADEVLELLRFISVRLSFRAKSRNLKKNDNRISFERWEKYSITQAFLKFAGITEEELFNQKLFIKKAKSKGYKVDSASYEDLFSQILAQEIEPRLGKSGYPSLLYDYPYELSSLAKLNKNGKIAERCEFYIDGLEVGGFCTELNDYKEQEKRFFQESEKRKKNNLINHTIDKGFIKTLKYGLPDCTGAGIGFDRLVMIFANVDSIDKLKLINIL
ncbi:MAG: Elongation factor P-(R)-beta-lysine ligase [Candidatus Roizmanbacteria bacterium GW2011_GWA2_32_13]|uniref:Elongation factor P-(R)-beta-lysine ligase n=1 Tax=Candidatus Roizmanbacteria bacterium GW2011_GWA2_32_13 TaxID=1618475 RepID=A0A0F9Z1N7_9BACT|nr:MAG: Elongation factor P-(R)-beta-lysine ligase [Candidatus Roizmanbacteria bacterium GW2011_GWA2_32_13]